MTNGNVRNLHVGQFSCQERDLLVSIEAAIDENKLLSQRATNTAQDFPTMPSLELFSAHNEAQHLEFPN
jgi:hypothetical protein